MVSLSYIRSYFRDIRWENLPVCGLDDFLKWNIEVKRRSNYNRQPGVIVGKKEWIAAYIAELMVSEEAKGIQGGVSGKPIEGPVTPERACADIRAEIPGGLLIGYKIARVTPDYYAAFGNHIRSDMFGVVCSGCDGYGVFHCNVCDGSRIQTVTCVSCHGTGKLMCNCDSGTTICSSCAGRGKTPRFMGIFTGVCASCSGSGRVQCQLCNGKGFNRCSKCLNKWGANSGYNDIPCSACAKTADHKCDQCEGAKWSALNGPTDKSIEDRLDWFRHAIDTSASPPLDRTDQKTTADVPMTTLRAAVPDTHRPDVDPRWKNVLNRFGSYISISGSESKLPFDTTMYTRIRLHSFFRDHAHADQVLGQIPNEIMTLQPVSEGLSPLTGEIKYHVTHEGNLTGRQIKEYLQIVVEGDGGIWEALL